MWQLMPCRFFFQNNLLLPNTAQAQHSLSRCNYDLYGSNMTFFHLSSPKKERVVDVKKKGKNLRACEKIGGWSSGDETILSLSSVTSFRIDNMVQLKICKETFMNVITAMKGNQMPPFRLYWSINSDVQKFRYWERTFCEIFCYSSGLRHLWVDNFLCTSVGR